MPKFLAAALLVSGCSPELFGTPNFGGIGPDAPYPDLPELPIHRALKLSGVISVAHRGAAAHCPENTMSAFRRAHELQVPLFEFDVRLSKDRHVVVLHDESLNRTTNGKGWVAERSYVGDIELLNAGSWFSAAYAHERVPTMRQVLDWVKDQPIAALVHTKQPGMTPEISALIKEFGLRGKIAILSEDLNDLARFKAAEPEVPTVFSNTSGLSEDEMLNRLLEGNHQGALLSQAQMNPALARRLHGVGIITGVFGTESEGDIHRALYYGAGMVLSKYPNRIQTLLHRRR